LKPHRSPPPPPPPQQQQQQQQQKESGKIIPWFVFNILTFNYGYIDLFI